MGLRAAIVALVRRAAPREGSALARGRELLVELAWRLRGCPSRTPHEVKRRLVRALARRFDLDQLVETGTQHGDMLAAVRASFRALYSVELSPALHELARARFAAHHEIHLLLGDSARVLPEVLRRLDGPALFWLDAHYHRHGPSARGPTDSPLLEELDAILAAPPAAHVVLIDDLHCLGRPGYPSLEDVRRRVAASGRDLAVSMEHDVLRLVPGSAGRVRLSEAIVAQRLFDYVREGFDQRVLELLPGGEIGHGRDALEERWEVARTRRGPRLDLHGRDGLTARLSPEAGRAWRGCWAGHERMPIALRPARPPPSPAAWRLPDAPVPPVGPTRIVQLYRRTVGFEPADKQLLPVSSEEDGAARFSRRRGAPSDLVLFAKREEVATGRLLWTKRYAFELVRQLPLELALVPALARTGAPAALPFEYQPELGLVFLFDPELFEGRAVHHHGSPDRAPGALGDAMLRFGATRVRHPTLGEHAIAELTDFQAIATRRGPVFLDFSLKPRWWWDL